MWLQQLLLPFGNSGLQTFEKIKYMIKFILFFSDRPAAAAGGRGVSCIGCHHALYLVCWH